MPTLFVCVDIQKTIRYDMQKVTACTILLVPADRLSCIHINCLSYIFTLVSLVRRAYNASPRALDLLKQFPEVMWLYIGDVNTHVRFVHVLNERLEKHWTPREQHVLVGTNLLT